MTEALTQLQRKGFTDGFKLENKKLKCLESGNTYTPDDLNIVEYHRFEGESNPSDMSVVFAVKCKDGTKGTIISSYGTYANMPLITFMDKVKIHDRPNATGKL